MVPSEQNLQESWTFFLPVPGSCRGLLTRMTQDEVAAHAVGAATPALHLTAEEGRVSFSWNLILLTIPVLGR